MADVYEQDLHDKDVETTRVAKSKRAPIYSMNISKQPMEARYLSQFVLKTNICREYLYNHNTFAPSTFDTYKSLPVDDAKALGKIYKMIVQAATGSKSREALEGTGGKSGIASGNPGAQTRMVIGDPIGWKMGGNFTDGLKSARKHKNENSWPTNDKFINGNSALPTNRLGASEWTKDNFAEWERYNCWICGLPLHWDDVKPEGEHKLPYGFMCVFGPGPVTKLCLVKDDDNDIKELDTQSNRRSIYSSVSATLNQRFEPEFKNWKDTCRGEEYAWSHPYCNKKKHSINFVKIGMDGNNDIVYYINYSGIKFVAEMIQDRKPVKRGNRYVLEGILTPAKGGSQKSFEKGVLNKLLRQCNTGDRPRFKKWGAKYMYENMVKQLKPLVYLLNESYPDMADYGVNDPQEKIRTNIYFNYKRLCKSFPQLKTRNDTNKRLHDFFNSIFDYDHGEESKAFLDYLFDNTNTMANYAAAGGGKIIDSELQKAQVTQVDVDTFLRQFTDIKLYETIFDKDLFEDPFDPNSNVSINRQLLNEIMGNPEIEVIDEEDKKVAAVAVATEHEEPDYGPEIKEKYLLNEMDISFMDEDEVELKSKFLKKLREEIIEDQKLASDLKMGVHNMIWLEYYEKLAQLYLDYFQDFFSKNQDKHWYKACCEGEGKEKLIYQIYHYLYPTDSKLRDQIESIKSFRVLYNAFREFGIGEFENAIKPDRHQKDEFYLYDEEKAFLRTRKDEINQMFADGNDIHYILGSLKKKYSIGLKSPHPQSLPPSVNKLNGWEEATDDKGNVYFYRKYTQEEDTQEEDTQEVVYPGSFSVIKRKKDLDYGKGYRYFKKFIESKDYNKPIEVILKEEFQRGTYEKHTPKPFRVYLEATKATHGLPKMKRDLQNKIRGEPHPIVPGQDKSRLGAFAEIASKASVHLDEERLLAEGEIAEKGGSGDVVMSGNDGGEIPVSVGEDVVTHGRANPPPSMLENFDQALYGKITPQRRKDGREDGKSQPYWPEYPPEQGDGTSRIQIDRMLQDQKALEDIEKIKANQAPTTTTGTYVLGRDDKHHDDPNSSEEDEVAQTVRDWTRSEFPPIPTNTPALKRSSSAPPPPTVPHPFLKRPKSENDKNMDKSGGGKKKKRKKRTKKRRRKKKKTRKSKRKKKRTKKKRRRRKKRTRRRR